MDTLFPLIVLLAIIWGAWKILSSKKLPPAALAIRPESIKKPSQSKRQSDDQDFHWPGMGNFDFEIVGESNYQSILAGLAGEHGAESTEAQHTATLLLEDSNPYDPKAVAVQIAGTTVGYLSREDARRYRRRLGQKRLTGVNATCDAIVVGGGTRRNGEKLSYGVKLDIKPFE
jgi:hypothetical protein